MKPVNLVLPVLLSILVVVLVPGGSPLDAAGQVIYVDPQAITNGNGSEANPFNTWAAVSFQPGNTYRQKAGTSYNGVLVVAVQGSAAAPVLIGSYGTGAAPIIRDTVVFHNAAFVTLRGFTMTGSVNAGVALQQASHHITIEDNTITKTGLGVWIGNGGAGATGSSATGSSRTPLTVSPWIGCTTAVGTETVMAGNTVYRNGAHGLEIDGNYYIIEHNTVYENGVSSAGVSSAGVSGIHLYAGGFGNDPFRDSGSHNIIRYNVAYRQRETQAFDGNGIQLDQNTKNNQVYGNLAYANDGAGIIAFDSGFNAIYGNVTVDNVRDPGQTHAPRMKGEIVLSATDTPPILDGSRSNTVTGNTAIANRPGIHAIAVDTLTADNPQTIGNNVFAHALGGNFYLWAGQSGNSLSAWNQLAAGGGHDALGGVRLNDAATRALSTMDHVFGPADQLELSLDGQRVKLIGWTVNEGLWVNVVDVVPPPAPAPTLTMTMTPTVITSGQSATLTWSSTNATSCAASGGWSGVQPTAGSVSGAPAQTSTFTLTCAGPGGSVQKAATITVVPPSCTSSGTNVFHACYYDTRDFNAQKVKRIDARIDFTWGAGSPDPAIAPDTFSVRWRGNFEFAAGSYDFVAVADDGIRVYVDNQLVINKWFDQSGTTTYRVRRVMTPGLHAIRVEYYENRGNARVFVGWERK